MDQKRNSEIKRIRQQRPDVFLLVSHEAKLTVLHMKANTEEQKTKKIKNHPNTIHNSYSIILKKSLTTNQINTLTTKLNITKVLQPTDTITKNINKD